MYLTSKEHGQAWRYSMSFGHPISITAYYHKQNHLYWQNAVKMDVANSSL